MEEYDPLAAPDPKQWLSLGEDERIVLIEDYHESARLRMPNPQMHAAIHGIVENQVALGEEIPVEETLQRLISEGLDRHEAIHAVGTLLAGHMFDLMGPEPPTDTSHKEYFDNLRSLTAQQWRSMGEGTDEPAQTRPRRRREPRPKRRRGR